MCDYVCICADKDEGNLVSIVSLHVLVLSVKQNPNSPCSICATLCYPYSHLHANCFM